MIGKCDERAKNAAGQSNNGNPEQIDAEKIPAIDKWSCLINFVTHWKKNREAKKRIPRKSSKALIIFNWMNLTRNIFAVVFSEFEFSRAFAFVVVKRWRHQIRYVLQWLFRENSKIVELLLYFWTMDWFTGSIGEAIQSAKLSKAVFVVVVHGKGKIFMSKNPP